LLQRAELEVETPGNIEWRCPGVEEAERCFDDFGGRGGV